MKRNNEGKWNWSRSREMNDDEGNCWMMTMNLQRIFIRTKWLVITKLLQSAQSWIRMQMSNDRRLRINLRRRSELRKLKLLSTLSLRFLRVFNPTQGLRRRENLFAEWDRKRVRRLTWVKLVRRAHYLLNIWLNNNQVHPWYQPAFSNQLYEKEAATRNSEAEQRRRNP